MSLESFTAAWRSGANSPGPEEVEVLAGALVRGLRRRARRLAVGLTAAGAVLVALTVAWVVRLLSPVEAAGEWALAPLLAPAWFALVLVLRRVFRHRTAHATAQGSIAALLRAALEETHQARSRLRWISVLHLVSLPALVLALNHLLDTTRVRPHELSSLAVVLAGLVAGSLLGMQLYDRFRLRPREGQLRELVASYSFQSSS